MKRTIKCELCLIEFPDHLISAFVNSEKTIDHCCPICALKARNKLVGLPEDTPFQGEQALWMWQEAVEYLKKKKHTCLICGKYVIHEEKNCPERRE